MQFSISFIAISALFVTALASPQRSRPSRPSRPVVNVNAAPNQQSNVCGNESQNPFCCTTDNQSGQVQCVSNNNVGGICDGTIVCCNSQNVNICLGNALIVVNSNNNVF